MSNKSFMAVDADKLRKELQEHHDFFVNAYGGFSNLPPKEKARVDEITQCSARVVNLRPVEAVEVVHGHWEWAVETHGDPMYGVDEDFGWRCSECQVWADEYGVEGDIYEEPPTHILHYCPNCGAKMDGGNEDG